MCTEARVATLETRRQHWAYEQTRRGERQAAYQTVIDLLSDWGWRAEYVKGFDIVRDFTIPFVRAANRVRVYGSPASVAAVDEIQESLALLESGQHKQGASCRRRSNQSRHGPFCGSRTRRRGPWQTSSPAYCEVRAGAGPRT